MKSFSEFLASIPNEEGFSAGTEQMCGLNANGMRCVLL
jgi:hypothetical protein